MSSSCIERAQCVFDGLPSFFFSYGFLFVNEHSVHPVASSCVSAGDHSRVKQASGWGGKGEKQGEVYHSLHAHA